MRARRGFWLTLLLGGGIFICLMFDSATALRGATEGIHVCLKTVIPVLLPYIFLSSLLTGIIGGRRIPLLRKLCQLCSIPAGAESIFLLGLISGYPVGAKLLGEAHGRGELSQSTAKRMLAFCSNAGPSFILGMLPNAFTIKIVPWLLWFIHVISAIWVAMLIPCTDHFAAKGKASTNADLSASMLQTLKSLSLICGWVILFRILIAFFHAHFYTELPSVIQVLFTGLMELANGCISLGGISNEAVRFIVCSCLLAFGGLCVMMQTSSVCNNLPLSMYFRGKILQTLISLVCALPVAYLIYEITPDLWFFLCAAAIVLSTILAVITFRKGKKKTVAIP